MSPAQGSLTARRILVVEDDYLVAEDVAELLTLAGAEAIGPAGSVADALRLATTEPRIDGAVLDVNVRGQTIWPVVDALRARGVKLVLTTGYGVAAIPPAYLDLPRCEKPAFGCDLLRALATALS